MRRFLTTFVLLVLCLPAFAQELEPAAAAALEKGEVAMRAALTTYERSYPDQPLWRQAINYGKEAVRVAPNRPEPLRFLAEVYSRSNWYGPAYDAWTAYMAAGYTLDPDAIPLFAEVGTELGYTAYSRKDLDAALEYYQSVADVVPYNTEAYVWAGRILLETGRPELAIPYWHTVTERDSTDQRAQYFLALAQEQSRWGVDAVNAFREGVQLYEDGDLSRAAERFARATSSNSNYAEAWAWLGRTAFETNNYDDAITYYREASGLEPTNETYRYFFEESIRRAS